MNKMETQNLRLVFESLINILSPIETDKKTITYYSECTGKKCNYKVYNSECNFSNISNYPNIPGYLIEINENNILILNDNLEYNINPDQLLTIWNRIKKTF